MRILVCLACRVARHLSRWFMPVQPVSFESFARLVRANPDYRPILVVDDVQTVTDLRALMNAAKLYADMRIMKIVLVISPGEVARRMLDYSSNSRAEVRTVDSFFSVQALNVILLTFSLLLVSSLHSPISICAFLSLSSFCLLQACRIPLLREFCCSEALLLRWPNCLR